MERPKDRGIHSGKRDLETPSGKAQHPRIGHQFDYYAHLADRENYDQGGDVDLGTVADSCAVRFCGAQLVQDERGQEQKRNEVRRAYLGIAVRHELRLPAQLALRSSFESLPEPGWIGLQVEFQLESPWSSKDDRPLHVLDNPVRKDRVFGVPFMAASSWKGLLRWACQREPEVGKPADWIEHLFGNERAATDDFERGALVFYPTWFSRIGIEVINPHSRQKRAGTQPIHYEVVPNGTKGVLELLYAPMPGDGGPEFSIASILNPLSAAIERLITLYGFSAKRTAGWGGGIVTGWTGTLPGQSSVRETTREIFVKALSAKLPGGVA